MRVCISSCLIAEKRHQQSAPLADKIGLKLSAKACFDPAAAPSCGSRLRFCSPVLTLAVHRMFKRLGALEKSNGGLNVSFLNTHPASDERVKVCTSHHGLTIDLIITKKQLEALLPEAFSIRGSVCGGMLDQLVSFGGAVASKISRTAWDK